MVEILVSNNNVMVAHIYSLMNAAVYDSTSAMMWFYFLSIGVVMGIIVGAYKKFLQNRWS